MTPSFPPPESPAAPDLKSDREADLPEHEETGIDGNPDSSFKLSIEQLDAAGLKDLKPGDSFSVTINGTVTDNMDGVTADIEEVTAGKKSSPEKPAPKGGSILSPEEAGFSADGM